jgi:serine/threonine protein kinase
MKLTNRSKIPFEEILAEIPVKYWEQKLLIGKLRDVRIDKTFYRPFSIVGKCYIVGDEATKTVFVKKVLLINNRTKEHHEKKFMEHLTATEFWNQSFGSNGNYRVVKLLYAIPEKSIIVTEESKGIDLYETIKKNALPIFWPIKKQYLIECIKNVSGWLRVKHQRMKIDEQVYDLNLLREYLHVRLKILTEDPRRKFPIQLRDNILRYLDQTRSDIPASDLLVEYTHSDFNPSNVLIDLPVITVLDFGRLAQESYLLDISKLYFQIGLFKYKPYFASKTIHTLQDVLLNSFNVEDIANKRLFHWMLLRHNLTHLTNITRFWKEKNPTKLYNQWVAKNEIQNIHKIINTI